MVSGQSKGIPVDILIQMKGHPTFPQSWAGEVDQNLSGLRFSQKAAFESAQEHEEFG